MLPLIPRPDRLDENAGALTVSRGFAPTGVPPVHWLHDTRRRLAAWGVLDPDGPPLEVVADPARAPESYRLTVTAERVVVTAADEAGLAHALGALAQLLPAGAHGPGGHTTGFEIGCLDLESTPRFPYRGAMVDLSRHFFSAVVLRDLVEILALFGYNRLHLHLSDDQGWRVESQVEPRLVEVATHRRGTTFGPDGPSDATPHGGYLTLAELRRLTDHSRALGVEIVAEIDLPGHTTALRAALPELGRPGETVEVLQTVGAGGSSVAPLPRTLDVLDRILAELVDVTGIRHVHLGGDECDMGWWEADPEVRAHRDALGLRSGEDLHAWFLRELATRLEARGVSVLMWDEAFVTGGLTTATTVTAWRGDAVAERAARDGALVRAPLFPTYFNFDQSTDPDEPRAQGGPITLRDVMRFDVAPASWDPAAHANVRGGQFNVWTEWITTRQELEYAIFPRALAMAEVLWRGAVDDEEELEDRIRRALEVLDARGVTYRPLDGPHPWQRGGLGRRRRTTGDDIEATRRWVESVSDRA